MTRSIRLLILVLTTSPLGFAQTVDTDRSRLIVSSLPSSHGSQAGGPIVSRFVDPFMTTRQVDRVYQFLTKPYCFQWDAGTTLVDIEHDLARYIPVELDISALYEIGLSADAVPYSLEKRYRPKQSGKASAESRSADPFAEHGKEASDREKKVSEHDRAATKNAEVGARASRHRSTHPKPTRWWDAQQRDHGDDPLVSNGAKLFHHLDSLSLTLSVVKGQLKITTIEQAEETCCVRIYDVTPLVDRLDRAEISAKRGVSVMGSRFHDYQSLSDLIQTTIAPDTWAALSGPSTIAGLSTADRCWLVVNVPLPIHWKIDSLLNRLNE